jgi:hypothetical protein
LEGKGSAKQKDDLYYFVFIILLYGTEALCLGKEGSECWANALYENVGDSLDA